jgi:hypothetical protein
MRAAGRDSVWRRFACCSCGCRRRITVSTCGQRASQENEHEDEETIEGCFSHIRVLFVSYTQSRVFNV